MGANDLRYSIADACVGDQRDRIAQDKISELELPRSVIEGYRRPPASPAIACFPTTLNPTADLKSKVVPCQFGGTPTVRSAAV